MGKSKGKKIIIVAGYAAAGKTAFALKLSKALGIPVFSKDLLKAALSRSISVSSRDDSKRLSAATFNAIAFIAERAMETGRPLIIEANFVMNPNHGGVKEGEVLKELTDKYGYGTLTYVFVGDSRVLFDRFNAREKTPERGEANKLGSELTYEDYERLVTPLGYFTVGGETVRVDTTDFDAVDFESYIETARVFMDAE